MMLGSGSEHSPQSARNHEGEQLIHLQPSWTQTTVLFFTVSTVFNKNDMRESTLYYKIVSVLDDSTQLQANVSVLSMFEVGEAQLRCLVG